MRFKLLACDIFTREICLCMAETPHAIDVEFSGIDIHRRPEDLRNDIQEKIDRLEGREKQYDAILLCYGLCGNAIAGIIARNTTIVIPRARDCGVILLGSPKRYSVQNEKRATERFRSRGMVERGERACPVLEDERRNNGLLTAMVAPLVYINIQLTQSSECIQQCREEAAAERREFVQLEGSLSLIRDLMTGSWYPNDFLVLRPGNIILAVGDENVVKQVKDSAVP